MSCTHDCGCPQETRDARTDEWVGTGTPPSASMAGPVARLRAEKAPAEVQGPDGRSGGGFRTKPNPRQPMRCPSIDPHDTLQCTRSIHSDDHCRNGGISWHRGSPRVLSDRERAELAEADLRHIAECLGEDPDDVPDGHRLVDHLALRVGYLRGRDAGFDDVEAERDTLAATLAHVEALAEDWRYKGQFGWGPWQIGEGPDPEGYVMDHCASALRAALADSEDDTTDTQPTDQEADRG